MGNKVKRLSGTIAALASARGMAGISVIRVSGEATKEIAKQMLGTELKHMHAKHVDIFGHSLEKIDSGVAIMFLAPNSYTGEDILEVSCHGNPIVVEQILDAAYAFGARPAEPGEFTKRAFLNDKIDLVQAEAVVDLIESTSVQAARAATRSLEGLFSKKVFSLSDQITKTRAIVEAALDFPDEDLKETGHEKMLHKNMEKTEASFLSLLEKTRTACRIREGAVVAITGEPNVGKSTLLNRLCGHERAIVSDLPGTTRDTIEESILLDGFGVTLIDTAGVRPTKNPIESEGVKRAIRASKKADIVIRVFDATKTKRQKASIEKNTLIVMNKADLLKNKTYKKDSERAVFYLSAKKGQGVSRLVEAISEYFGENNEQAISLTARRRHLTSLNESYDCFKRANIKLAENITIDLVAEDLLQAQNVLSEITGEFSTEDLLGKIFNEFCIGK